MISPSTLTEPVAPVSNGKTVNSDRDPRTGKFATGNKAAVGKKRRAKDAVEVPPPPEPVAKAGLSSIWASVFRRAVTGSSRDVSLLLQLRKSSFSDLTGIDDDEFSDAEIRRILDDDYDCEG